MAISDTQLLILSAASQRTDHAATLPANLKGSAAKKVIDRLLKQKLLQELRAKDDMPIWRRGNDSRSYTLRITKAGLKAIEVEDVADAPDNRATGSRDGPAFYELLEIRVAIDSPIMPDIVDSDPVDVPAGRKPSVRPSLGA